MNILPTSQLSVASPGWTAPGPHPATESPAQAAPVPARPRAQLHRAVQDALVALGGRAEPHARPQASPPSAPPDRSPIPGQLHELTHALYQALQQVQRGTQPPAGDGPGGADPVSGQGDLGSALSTLATQASQQQAPEGLKRAYAQVEQSLSWTGADTPHTLMVPISPSLQEFIQALARALNGTDMPPAKGQLLQTQA
ncbi:hypothetical protein ACG0Z6_00105 [Roseateles sp. BYS180W]|uniref:Type III effector protein n=1 Tax=Roseateles rivi TaxID=3299028 RepID=A0ABW7FQL9_9BURK